MTTLEGNTERQGKGVTNPAHERKKNIIGYNYIYNRKGGV